MSEPPSRIDFYKQQAATFIAKAETVPDSVSKHYLDLAEAYLQLIEMEIRRIEIRGES
jgi:hypothetical protein